MDRPIKMWVMAYSRQHRRLLGCPVRMRVACAVTAPSQQRNFYRIELGSALVPIAAPRATPDSAYRVGAGHSSVVAKDSRGSELLNTAGGVAVRVAVCSQCAEARPPGRDDLRDLSLGCCQVLGATVACVARGTITAKHVPADRPGPGRVCRGIRPDAQDLRYGSPAKVTHARLGRNCFACPTRTSDTWDPLNRQRVRDSLRRTSRKCDLGFGTASTHVRHSRRVTRNV